MQENHQSEAAAEPAVAPAETSPETAAAGVPGAALKKRRTRGIIAGVVAAAIVVVAGAAFLVWNEQPSFCNAICHTPMDPYVEGYNADDLPPC